MISLQNVTKSFGSKKVLNSVSLQFEAHKTHILLGSSGCGKSTLIRCLMGLTHPNSGDLSVDGMSIGPNSQRDLALRVGYVIQEGGLFPHLTASQNVSLVAGLNGWTPEQISKRIQTLGELVDLDKQLLNRFPKALSGGQRQRVALMRALMLDPDILLLDEPLGALDPITRSQLQADLRNIFSSLKKTVILVTHDLGEAAFFGDTITLLANGNIMQHGTFDELVQNPADPFVSEFLRAQRPVPLLSELL